MFKFNVKRLSGIQNFLKLLLFINRQIVTVIIINFLRNFHMKDNQESQ